MIRRVMLLKRYWPKNLLTTRNARSRIAKLGRQWIAAPRRKETSLAIRSPQLRGAQWIAPPRRKETSLAIRSPQLRVAQFKSHVVVHFRTFLSSRTRRRYSL